MQPVSDAYREEMTRPVMGAAKLIVNLSVVDENAAPGAADKSEGQAYWSSVESALTQDGAQKRSYATFEPGRWKADGALRIADEPGGALLTEGYVSEAMSGADGRFKSPPVLALEFATPVSVPALTFRFDQVAGEWCTALTVTTWNRRGAIGAAAGIAEICGAPGAGADSSGSIGWKSALMKPAGHLAERG